MQFVSHLLLIVNPSACVAVISTGSSSMSSFQYIQRRPPSLSGLRSFRSYANNGPSQALLSYRLLSIKSANDQNKATADVEKAEPASFTWPQLIRLFRLPNENNHFVPSNHPKLELFRRSAVVQSKYLAHRSMLRHQWKSPYDYLCVNKFGKNFGFQCMSVKIQADSGNNSPQSKYEANPCLKAGSDYAIKNDLRYLSLVHNDFPYDVDEKIDHYCLWKIGGTTVREGILEDEMKWAITELSKCSQENFIGSIIIVKHNEVEDYATKHQVSFDEQHGIVDYLYWVSNIMPMISVYSISSIVWYYILLISGEPSSPPIHA